MRKISLILALMAGCMLPLTAVAKPADSTSKKSRKKTSSSSKSKTTTTTTTTTSSSSSTSSAPSTDSAKDAKPVGGKMSTEQIMLNNQAQAAVQESKFNKAEQLFIALLELGEFNVIWYQLGKTYAREDKCIEAYDAFSEMKENMDDN